MAVQRPCTDAVPPRTYLQRTDDGLYRIQWRHPRHGTGCLTVLAAGDYRGTLEPWDDCRAAGPAQLFLIEQSGTSARWRIRPAYDDGLCLDIHGETAETGAAAMTEPCTAADGRTQAFLIGPE